MKSVFNISTDTIESFTKDNILKSFTFFIFMSYFIGYYIVNSFESKYGLSNLEIYDARYPLATVSLCVHAIIFISVMNVKINKNNNFKNDLTNGVYRLSKYLYFPVDFLQFSSKFAIAYFLMKGVMNADSVYSYLVAIISGIIYIFNEFILKYSIYNSENTDYYDSLNIRSNKIIYVFILGLINYSFLVFSFLVDDSLGSYVFLSINILSLYEVINEVKSDLLRLNISEYYVWAFRIITIYFVINCYADNVYGFTKGSFGGGFTSFVNIRIKTNEKDTNIFNEHATNKFGRLYKLTENRVWFISERKMHNIDIKNVINIEFLDSRYDPCFRVVRNFVGWFNKMNLSYKDNYNTCDIR